MAGWIARAHWLRHGSAHRRVLSAAGVVAAFTFGAKLIAAGKEVVVARQFGVSDQVDAFGLAMTLPAFAIVLIGGSLNAALVPAYVDERQREGDAAAQRLLATVMVLTIGLLLAASLALAALVPALLPLVSDRFTPEKLRLTTQLTYLLTPSVMISGVSMTWTAVLQAHGRFAPSASAGLVVPLVAVLTLLAGGHAYGIRALAVGTVLGYGMEALLIGRAVTRQGLSIVPRWGGWTPAVRRIAEQYVPVVAGVMVMGMNPVIDSLMAARLDAGSVASLNYGNKVVAFGMGIGAVSLTSAVFPHFSALASKRDWGRLSRTIRAYALVLLALSVPVVLAGVAFSQPIVRLLYQRGAFSAADTVQVARIQALYLLQVPFHLMGLLFVRFVSAASRNTVLMWGNVISCVVNVVGNIVFARYLGAAGIALSTSVVYVVSCGYLGWCTWRQLAALRATQPEAVGLGEPT